MMAARSKCTLKLHKEFARLSRLYGIDDVAGIPAYPRGSPPPIIAKQLDRSKYSIFSCVTQNSVNTIALPSPSVQPRTMYGWSAGLRPYHNQGHVKAEVAILEWRLSHTELDRG